MDTNIPARPSTACRASAILAVAAETLMERDGRYRGADTMLARVMEQLFPDGITLQTEEDHHRFHLVMLLVVKLTRYVRNWKEGHADSLIDLINYGAMLAAVDGQRARPSEVRGEGPV